MVDLEGKALVLPADDVVFAVFQDLAYVCLLPVGVSLLSPYSQGLQELLLCFFLNVPTGKIAYFLLSLSKVSSNSH